jgi:hypothetical protein
LHRYNPVAMQREMARHLRLKTYKYDDMIYRQGDTVANAHRPMCSYIVAEGRRVLSLSLGTSFCFFCQNTERIIVIGLTFICL